MTELKPFRSGYVAIIGRPNAGKSTLLNQILSIKLSIVSPRPQTTRRRVMGIYNCDNAQIIFLDTPGWLTPKYALQSAMMKIIRQAIDSADLWLMIIDATDSDISVPPQVLEVLRSGRCPSMAVLNKVDITPKPELLPKIAELDRYQVFKEIIPLSALTGDGVDRLKEYLIRYLPSGEPFYPPDMLTEQPERFFVAEIIREKIFEYYEKEIPYSTEVVIDEFKEHANRKDYIKATIFVERSGQKAILIGEKGKALKTIGERARTDIEAFIGRPVYLELWVKVKENWRKNNSILKYLGY